MTLAAFNPGQLREFTRTFEDLFYAADAASMTAYYAEDAQLMADAIDPPQSPDSGAPPSPAPPQHPAHRRRHLHPAAVSGRERRLCGHNWGREQVAGRQAAVGPPLLGDG